jgi:hypothetical protein
MLLLLFKRTTLVLLEGTIIRINISGNKNIVLSAFASLRATTCQPAPFVFLPPMLFYNPLETLLQSDAIDYPDHPK